MRIKENFEKELGSLINKHSLENESDTPDYILAAYIRQCLIIFSVAVKQRDKWFGFIPFKNNERSVT